MKLIALLSLFSINSFAVCPIYYHVTHDIKPGDRGIVYESINKALTLKNYAVVGDLSQAKSVLTVTIVPELHSYEDFFQYKTSITLSEMSGKTQVVGLDKKLSASIHSAINNLAVCKE